MADVIFVLVALAFFGLCVGYVRWLDRMARSSDDAVDPSGSAEVTR